MLEQAATLMLPKDFLRFRLTGEPGTDQSDAASSGLFDVRQRVWADEVIERLAPPRSIFPHVHASAGVVGPLSQSAAAELGLRQGIPVSAGCADQPAQAVGNGLLDPPLGSVTIGTGGQVFVPLTEPLIDPALRLHTFCHAPPARWYLLGGDVVGRHGAEMAPVRVGKGRDLPTRNSSNGRRTSRRVLKAWCFSRTLSGNVPQSWTLKPKGGSWV
jgi:sugar (pentulose or hexulose) kinase